MPLFQKLLFFMCVVYIRIVGILDIMLDILFDI